MTIKINKKRNKTYRMLRDRKTRLFIYDALYWIEHGDLIAARGFLRSAIKATRKPKKKEIIL